MANNKQNNTATSVTDDASVQPSLHTVYAVGDIQGCLDSLDELIDQLPDEAQLIFLGDIINRGPRSLESLRRVKELITSGKSLGMVLGNHDLHLLAVAAGAGKLHRKDTIGEILTAPDRDELIDWLRRQPLLLEVPQAPDFVFVHAGIPPQWSMKDARSRAREIETMLRSDDWAQHLADMYGNDTDPETADSAARMRAILNSFTRMRYLTRDGEQDFAPKMNPKQAPKG
ncbi:MAG: symmetrical bis(5'-nucleosyl)-tetraphosphatase, partial [Duodenibacillus sp.]